MLEYTGDWAGPDFKERPLDAGKYEQPLFPFDFYSQILDVLNAPSTSPKEKTWCNLYIQVILFHFPSWTRDDCVPNHKKESESFLREVRESIRNVEGELRQHCDRCTLVDDIGIIYDEVEETMNQPGDIEKQRRRWQLEPKVNTSKKRAARSSSPPKESIKEEFLKGFHEGWKGFHSKKDKCLETLNKVVEHISSAAGISISCRILLYNLL